ncbi:BOI-related E3 ubiquitin-protein ligase 1-like [Curcuma longa]|uniref:BOI-related E3 ubiquitin-protein ligase 1-like n=1 Tax=Curcuma longa TaxID=136217 RepID=UPI003D9F0F2D
MAVHSRRTCNFPFLNGGERDRKEMDLPRAATGFVDPSALLLSDGGAPTNPRKRGAESIVNPAVPMPRPQNGSVDLSSRHLHHSSTPFSPPVIVSLAQVPSHPAPVVSTEIRLALEEQYQQQNQNMPNPLLCSSSSLLISRIDQQKQEIEELLRVQGEQFQIALAERHRRHYRSLLCAARATVAKRIREKEAELERAAQRSAELQNRLVRLRSESIAWQAKAMADQAMAASLHAQLQQALAAAAALSQARSGDTPQAEDAESAIVDPNRLDQARTCRSCRRQPATVVLLPCRHLSLCDACDAAAGDCPICQCNKTGSVRVFLA